MSKKKYTQNDLRRLMQEQKLKVSKAAGINSNNIEKIDSPLAKYENGKLTCILCKSVVRSETVWKVHINSKSHREKVAAAKELKDHLISAGTANENRKRTNKDEALFVKPEIPAKIAKTDVSYQNSEDIKDTKCSIPSDFFDEKSTFFSVTLNKTSIKKDLVNIKRNSNEETKMEVEETIDDDKLPEGFFDDPVKDAKIRNTEYKDPQEEEWEKFQREIKEETTHSVEIIAGEHEEAIAERQIEEIDEQIQNWSRVLNMEKKTESILSKKQEMRSNCMDLDEKLNDSDDEDVNLDNLTDWRAKKLKLKS
ncbi:zinc finger protein 830 [Condylostylus longicornis]|uniref:zinc finger protein 830 n=1 Tax=Condylostylus longicornis TaxID=2530218 RepID=UPI00244DE36B|nr:zinc finger protein 830 [Condylostylus longicornis]